MKRFLLLFLILCLWLNHSVVYAAPIYQGKAYLPPQCEEIKEVMLRVDLNHNIQDFFTNETNFDLEKIIDRQWRVLNLDSVIDSEIDNAIISVNNDAGFINRFKSSWLPSKAGELANEVTEIAFNSSVLNNKLNQLSINIAEELSEKIELISAQSSSYAMDCLQKFINRQYSQTFVNIFGKKIENSVPDAGQVIGTFNPDTVKFFNSHQFAFGGAAAFAVAGVTRKLITQKIIGRVTQQIGERILGRIGASAIPLIGEIVGGGMIAYDIFKSFEGALPAIQASLKTPEIKNTFRQEISKKIDEELRTESSQIAREISNDIYAEWLDFQKDYHDALSLAGELPEFQDILAKETDISKISSLVGISLNNMGRSQLVESVQDGTFERALSLPETTYKMLETTHSLTTLVDWTNLAGNQIEDVVKLELYKHLSPQDLDRKLLAEILSLKDFETIAKLSLLDPDSIRKLLMISKPNLVELTANLSIEDLEKLAGYLESLEQPKVNQIVKFLLNDDTSIIKNTSVMTHIVQSRDLDAAIQFWNAPINFYSLLDSTLKMYTGVINWQLFTDKCGKIVVFSLIGLPVILLLLVLLAIMTWFYRQWLEIIQKKQSLQTEQK